MAIFYFKAVSPSGEIISGSLEGHSQRAVAEKLYSVGNTPLEVEPSQTSTSSASHLFSLAQRHGVLRRGEVSEFTHELAVMLDAGQDLDAALNSLIDTASSKTIRRFVLLIRTKVRDGGSLAGALADHPRSFSRLYIALVRAGEAGGMIASSLKDLTHLLERQGELRATVISALIYPTVLVFAGLGAIVVLLTEVLPQFQPLFDESGASLPEATRIVLWLSNAITSYTTYLMLGAATSTVAIIFALKITAIRSILDAGLLNLPVLGTLLRELDAAWFCRCLGALLENDVPILEALALAEGTLRRSPAQGAVRAAADSAKEGKGIAATLHKSRAFPGRMTSLLRLGEDTARLGEMATKAAEIHERGSARVIERIVSLVVPSLIIVIGAIVAGIVASLMLAMVSLNDLVQ